MNVESSEDGKFEGVKKFPEDCMRQSRTLLVILRNVYLYINRNFLGVIHI